MRLEFVALLADFEILVGDQLVLPFELGVGRFQVFHQFEVFVGCDFVFVTSHCQIVAQMTQLGLEQLLRLLQFIDELIFCLFWHSLKPSMLFHFKNLAYQIFGDQVNGNLVDAELFETYLIGICV